MFYLPDGSNGWLNGDSYLKFPERFQGKTRDVTLKGEAFFDVITNPKKPFVVSSKYLDIVAKGTSFNVSAWDDVPETEVVMVEGKVDVYFTGNNQRKKVTSLSPSQLLHCVPSKTGTYIQDVDIEKYISWTEGRLIFKEDPFSEVVERLNRWYSVNIVIKDKILESYEYVATFEDETLDEILKMLTISAPIRYKELQRTQKEDGTFMKRTIELYYKPMKVTNSIP
jgi:ferric-dicitrate binding protein FerR (iron transport regulator)